jgi:hypothetical protein
MFVSHITETTIASGCSAIGCEPRAGALRMESGGMIGPKLEERWFVLSPSGELRYYKAEEDCGVMAVSRSRAGIGSPCLRRCGHGASKGGHIRHGQNRVV